MVTETLAGSELSIVPGISRAVKTGHKIKALDVWIPRYALVSLKNRVLEPTTPKPKNATKEAIVGARIRLVTTKISDVNQDRFPSQAMTIRGAA